MFKFKTNLANFYFKRKLFSSKIKYENTDTNLIGSSRIQSIDKIASNDLGDQVDNSSDTVHSIISKVTF